MFKHKECDYCWIPSQFSVSFRVHPCSYAPYSFASTQYLTKMPLESLPSIMPRYFTSISVGRSLMFSSPQHMRRWSPPPRADSIGGLAEPWSPQIHRPAGERLPSDLARPTSPWAWQTAKPLEMSWLFGQKSTNLGLVFLEKWILSVLLYLQ